jgi:hypothetical protein
MGTLLISKIREEYPDRMMMTFSVVPSPKAWRPGQRCAHAVHIHMQKRAPDIMKHRASSDVDAVTPTGVAKRS